MGLFAGVLGLLGGVVLGSGAASAKTLAPTKVTLGAKLMMTGYADCLSKLNRLEAKGSKLRVSDGTTLESLGDFENFCRDLFPISKPGKPVGAAPPMDAPTSEPPPPAPGPYAPPPSAPPPSPEPAVSRCAEREEGVQYQGLRGLSNESNDLYWAAHQATFKVESEQECQAACDGSGLQGYCSYGYFAQKSTHFCYMLHDLNVKNVSKGSASYLSTATTWVCR